MALILGLAKGLTFRKAAITIMLAHQDFGEKHAGSDGTPYTERLRLAGSWYIHYLTK
jgi:hypothetical protein